MKETNLSQKVLDLSTRLVTTEQKLNIYESRAASNLNPLVEDERCLELQIADKLAELETYRENLNLEREKVATFKAIASASEEQLAHINSTYDTYKETMDAQLHKLESQVLMYEKKSQDLEERLEKTAFEVTSAHERANEERLNWEQGMKQMTHDLTNAIESESFAVRNMNIARDDLSRQLLIVQDAQNNYEREVVAHSKKIEALSVIREEYNALKGVNNDLDHLARIMTSNKAISDQALIDLQARFTHESQEFVSRIEELEEQNNSLHQHLEKINSQALLLQAKTAENIAEGDATFEPNEAIYDELREVIRFLRREKDILFTKHEIVCQENQRTQLQIDHTQRSLDETRAILQEERFKNSDSVDAGRKHAELLEKVNQLNILRESNVTLRDQNENNFQKINVLQKTLSDAEDTIGPLKSDNFKI